ncbi:MAG TPA: DUF3846 domain-containing protein [Rugosimonospora sp.]|jgi:hypothetical protein
MGASITRISAALTAVVARRRGDLFDDRPLAQHTLILDGLDDVVLVAGSPDQLDNLARGVRREVDALHSALSQAPQPAAAGSTPPAAGSSRQSAALPPSLDYVAVDPDGRIRIVCAILAAGGSLPILQSAVGGYIEHVPTSDDVDCFANEEGLLLGLAHNRIGGLVHQRLTGLEHPRHLVGTIVFVASTGEDTTSLTLEQRRRIVEAWTAADGDRYLD